MSLAEVTDEEEDFNEIDRRLRELIERDKTATVAYYALLSPRQKGLVQEQNYWQLLDEKIESMLYGQI